MIGSSPVRLAVDGHHEGPRRGHPTSLIQDGVARVRMAAFLVALGHAGLVVPQFLIAPELATGAMIATSIGLVSVTMGFWAAIPWLLRVGHATPRRAAERVLDLALVWAALLCFAFALTEALPGWSTGWHVGASWACVTIAAIPLVIPSPPARVLFTACAAAVLVAVAMLVAIALGQPWPTLRAAVSHLAPPWVTVVVAYGLARIVYDIGVRVEAATELGAYRLEERLGVGGMGEVWRARHRLLARPAAVKLIRERDGSRSAIAAVRFEREAQRTASLSSPHTVQIHDYGVAEDGRFFLAMELLEGLDLERLVRRHGPLDEARVALILCETLESLAEAHHKGLIHRDVKPANIALCRVGLTRDFTKVLDFGLATLREADEDEPLTGEGAITGTAAYLAPEIAQGGKDVDGRSDLYSVGCVAYWLLTGTTVFQAATPIAHAVHHARTPPEPPSSRVQRPIDAGLEAWVLRLLSKTPDERPASATAARDELRALGLHRAWTAERAEAWWARTS